MSKYVFDRLEFYITNVCNLTCDGCNRYNNYKFSGFWPWEEAEPVLRAWAEKIDVKHPVILGGEPLLHPDIVKWITGLREIFPNYSGVQVQSNGTRIDCVKGLYQRARGISQMSDSFMEPWEFKYAQLIVEQCIELVNERCEDLANGDVLRDPVLWESVTREYGADKKRHFDPVGIAIDLASMLKQNFGVD